MLWQMIVFKFLKSNGLIKGLKEYHSVQKLHKKPLKLVKIFPYYSFMLKSG